MTRHLLAGLFAFALTLSAAGEPPGIYFVPFSHLDLFWGGTREECLTRGNRIIAKAIRLAQASPKFRFLLEDNVFVSNYVETHGGTAELAALKRLVKEGRIEIGPKWAAIYQDIPDGELQVRNLAIGKRYAREVFGVDPLVVHLGDLPGYTPQFPQIVGQARVPFTVMTRMGPSNASLFRWRSPDGSRTLVWNSLKSYGWGTFLTSKTQDEEKKLERFRKDLAEVRATTKAPIFMHWGIDLYAPPDDLVERIEALSRTSGENILIATPADFFRRVEKMPEVPELAGEIPSSWPNLISSLPHIWPAVIPATNTLLAAERFAAINHALGYAAYPRHDLDLLWKKLLESNDHNQDGQGGYLGDVRKVEYSQRAVTHGGDILRESLRNIAERVKVAVPGGFPLVVFNPLGWTRDDVVRAHATLYGDVAPSDIGAFKKGLRLVDENGRPVPVHVEEYAENISRSLHLAFVATGVPSLGYKTYYLVAGDAPDTFPAAAKVSLDSGRDLRDSRRVPASDVLENRFYRVSVDHATGRVTLFDKALNRDVARDMEISALEERGGNYIGIEPPSGRAIPALVDEIRLEENNAVRAVLRIALRIGDIPIVQRLTLYAGLKRLDVENTVDWNRPRYVRVQQLIPLAGPDAALHYGIPFGANNAANILPGAGTRFGDEIKNEAWRTSRLIQDWIHVGLPGAGLTIATDHQQIRLGQGVIHAEMLRGTKFTSAKVVRGETVGSLHYPLPGRYTFHYTLSSDPGDWRSAKAWRAGRGLTNPLLAVSVADDISAKTLPPTQSFCSVEGDNLVISALKKADQGDGLVLRVYETAGGAARTPIRLFGQSRPFIAVNLLEEEMPGGPRRSLEMGPYAIRTVKVEMKP